jgi:hypothetical protein
MCILCMAEYSKRKPLEFGDALISFEISYFLPQRTTPVRYKYILVNAV